MTDAANALNVDVTLRDNQIEMQDPLFAGPTNFVVHNESSKEHNFEIKGLDLDESFDQSLKPGETKVLQVDLTPGAYDVSCPIHKEHGMERQLNVNGPRRAAPEARIFRDD